MTIHRTVRRGAPTREELELRQRARVARIQKTSAFPWRRFIMGLFLGILSVILLGGGILSLFVAMMIITVVSRGRISYRRNPMDK